MATNFRVEIDKIGLFITFSHSHGILKQIAISPFYDDLDTLCVNLVNFGPITPEKDVHTSFLSLK